MHLYGANTNSVREFFFQVVAKQGIILAISELISSIIFSSISEQSP